MRRWLVGTTLAMAGLALVGCTGSSSNSAAGGKAAEPAAAARGAAEGGSALSRTDTGARVKALSAKAPLIDVSAKIRIAEMTVSVKRGDVASAANRAEAIAFGAGGDVDSDDRSSGRDATAALVLRVPPPALTSVLSRLSGLGHETSRQLSTTDVTQKVADVDSRVRSAQGSIARLRTLYANAKKVADVIAIEQELNDRESDLESLQAQQRSLSQETSMATVTLTLRAAAVVAPKKPQHHTHGGFVGGLERGWHGFVAAASWCATALGTLLPFLLLLAALGAGARIAWRRMPHGPRPTPAPAPSE